MQKRSEPEIYCEVMLINFSDFASDSEMHSFIDSVVFLHVLRDSRVLISLFSHLGIFNVRTRHHNDA